MAKVTKELLEQNVAKLNGQMGSTLFEAGKSIGRLEGARDMLAQVLAMMDAKDVSPEEAVAEVAASDPAEGQ